MAALFIVLALSFIAGAYCVLFSNDAQYRLPDNIIIAMVFVVVGGLLVEIKYRDNYKGKTEKIIPQDSLSNDTIITIKFKQP